MYESFYGLSAKPFKLNPDPGFYFGSKQHARARAYLEYGVSRNEGFIVITGEIGAGKTTVLRGLIESLDGSNVVVGHLVTTQVDHEDVLRMVGAAFGVPVKDVPKALLLGNIEAFLLTQAAQNRRCLLVVDEAQNLTARAVEELRMLSNFQYGDQSLLQTFLVGQPEFRRIVQQPDMEQFRQRVSATCHIDPMDAGDVRAYIEHRLNAAGSKGWPFIEEEVYAEVHRASSGIPRRVNAVMDRLLLSGFLQEKQRLSLADAQEVTREIEAEGLGARSSMPAVASAPALTNSSTPAAPAFPGPRSVEVALDAMTQAELAQRLDRLEESMLWLERINRETLGLMKTMVQTVKQLADAAPAQAAPPSAQGEVDAPAQPSEADAPVNASAAVVHSLVTGVEVQAALQRRVAS